MVAVVVVVVVVVVGGGVGGVVVVVVGGVGTPRDRIGWERPAEVAPPAAAGTAARGGRWGRPVRPRPV